VGGMENTGRGVKGEGVWIVEGGTQWKKEGRDR
jgi:hypothetical protein